MQLIVDTWVKVIYEKEVLVGKVSEKRAGEAKVQCLQHPFGIKVPQHMVKEHEVVFYTCIYHTDTVPKLKQFDRVGSMYTSKDSPGHYYLVCTMILSNL